MNTDTANNLYIWPKAYDQHIMLVDDAGHTITYAEAKACGQEMFQTLKSRSVIVILCRNTFGSVLTYIHALRSRLVPMLLPASMDPGFFHDIVDSYAPEYIAAPSDCDPAYIDSTQILGSIYDYTLYSCQSSAQTPVHDALALLLSTSGSTGSPKFVRQSYHNLQSNALSICQYLNITENDRPITTLPMHYTYGLSIINSHILKGAALLLTTHSILEADFWDFFTKENATTFGGVPYTYEMLKKLQFHRLSLPSLKVMTQAGGHLSRNLQNYFVDYACQTGKKMIIMYGQTEATARMSYLPFSISAKKEGSIGIPIPGGRFELIDTDGSIITAPETIGDLIYYGPNVTMGYASCRGDLSNADENHGRLATGDMAKMDADGYYYIVGRKKRFIKLYGHRISLDEIEELLKNRFPNIDFACIGDDDSLCIYTTAANSALNSLIIDCLTKTCNIYPRTVQIQNISEIPKNSAGKIQYRLLKKT